MACDKWEKKKNKKWGVRNGTTYGGSSVHSGAVVCTLKHSRGDSLVAHIQIALAAERARGGRVPRGVSQRVDRVEILRIDPPAAAGGAIALVAHYRRGVVADAIAVGAPPRINHVDQPLVAERVLATRRHVEPVTVVERAGRRGRAPYVDARERRLIAPLAVVEPGDEEVVVGAAVALAREDECGVHVRS